MDNERNSNEKRIISVFIVTITLWGLIKYISGGPLLSSVGRILDVRWVFGRQTAKSYGYTNSDGQAIRKKSNSEH